MTTTFTFSTDPIPESTGSARTPLFVRPGASRSFPLGTDIAGVLDLDAGLTTVSGRLALAQRILRRLTTPRGGLLGSSSYGYDVLSMVGSSVPASVVEQRVLEQVLYEEEVEDAQCAATMNAATSEMTVELSVVDADGPFDLVLTASELTVSALIDDQPLFQETL